MTRMEELFRALADVTRLRILGLLLTGEVRVSHIHSSLRISQPKASRHLAYLRRAGLVDARKEGLWVLYRLAVSDDPILRVIQQGIANALRHATVVEADAGRLGQLTGGRLPVVGEWHYQQPSTPIVDQLAIGSKTGIVTSATKAGRWPAGRKRRP